MDKPWFIDVMTYMLVALWMGWTFTTIQKHGPDPWLLASAVTVLGAGLLLIYNQRLAYLRVGDWVVLGTRDMTNSGDTGEVEQWREENR